LAAVPTVMLPLFMEIQTHVSDDLPGTKRQNNTLDNLRFVAHFFVLLKLPKVALQVVALRKSQKS
jgi:hypothetical protein